MRKEVKVIEVLEITQGGNNAWVMTNIGKLKKPLNAIPRKFLEEYTRKKENK